MNDSISFSTTGVTNTGLEGDVLDNDNGGRYCRAYLENEMKEMIWKYTCMFSIDYSGGIPSITDTIGTNKLIVLLMEVSFVEGSFNIIKYQIGTRKVSLVVRCLL